MADRPLVERQAWIIWAALLFGQIVYAGVMVYLVNSEGFEGSMKDVGALRPVAFVTAALSYVVSRKVRTAIFAAKADEDGKLTPEGMMAGNIAGWAIFETASLVAITCGLLAGAAVPYLYAAGIAMAGQICYYPRH
jgi:hypothetical protein